MLRTLKILYIFGASIGILFLFNLVIVYSPINTAYIYVTSWNATSKKINVESTRGWGLGEGGMFNLLNNSIYQFYNFTPPPYRIKVHVLLLVTSSPIYFERRMAVRNTWMTQCRSSKVKILLSTIVIFLSMMVVFVHVPSEHHLTSEHNIPSEHHVPSEIMLFLPPWCNCVLWRKCI